MLRRFSIALALLACATPATAQRIGPSNANPRPIRTPLQFDLRDYQRAGDANPAVAFQRAHDAAAAAVASTFGQTPMPACEVLVPPVSGGYTFDRTVFHDSPWVKFAGGGAGSLVKMGAQSGYPAFLVGLPRAAGVQPGPSYRPDLHGKLDASAAPAAGYRWGFRSNGNAFLFSQGSAFTHGGFSPTIASTPDAWIETPVLVFEYALEGFASGSIPANTPIDQLGSVPAPHALATGATAGSWKFSLGTQTAQFSPVTVTDYTFSSAVATGVQRITIQVDMGAHLVTAWAGGGGAQPVQVAVSGGGAIPGSATILNQNVSECWVLAPNVRSITVPFGLTVGDFAVYGRCLKRAKSYAVGATGSAQVANPQVGGVLYLCGGPTGGSFTATYRGQTTGAIPYSADAATMAASIQSALTGLSTIGAGNVVVTPYFGANSFSLTPAGGFSFAAAGNSPSGVTCDGSNLTGQSITDCYRYFPAYNQLNIYSDPNALAYLAFDEDPTSAPRQLRIGGGQYQAGGVNSAAFIGSNDAYGPGFLTTSFLGAGFRDISITAAPGYGQGIMVMGGTNGFTLDRVVSEGGGVYAFSALNHGANYTHQFRDCRFGATDAPVFLFYSGARMDGINFLNPGRACVKAVGSSVFLSNFNVESWAPQHESMLQFLSEGYGGAYTVDHGTVDFEGVGYRRSAIQIQRHAYAVTRLDLSNMVFQETWDVPIVELQTVGLFSVWPLSELTMRNVITTGGTAGISGDGPGWVGTVPAIAGRPQHILQAGTLGRSGIVTVDRNYRLPFRSGQWFAGNSIFTPQGPRDAMPREYHVARDGTWGTAAPPGYIALGAVPLDPNASLASASVAHVASVATVSGHPSTWGMPTFATSAGISAALFNGAALTVPANWGFGLETVSYNRDAARTEATTPGYVRASIANNLTSFPAASAGTKANGVAIAFGTITAPLTATGVMLYDAGGVGRYMWRFVTPVTFAAGSTPTIPVGGLTFANAPVPGFGTLSDYGFGKVYDALFGGQALGAPATWYAALSTAALTQTSTAPTEPSGGGYARAAIPADAAHWPPAPGGTDQQFGDVSNAAAVPFPAPTGAQGPILGGALTDALTGGALWFTLPLTGTPSPVSGGAAPTFAPGALTIGL